MNAAALMLDRFSVCPVKATVCKLVQCAASSLGMHKLSAIAGPSGTLIVSFFKALQSENAFFSTSEMSSIVTSYTPVFINAHALTYVWAGMTFTDRL